MHLAYAKVHPGGPWEAPRGFRKVVVVGVGMDVGGGERVMIQIEK